MRRLTHKFLFKNYGDLSTVPAKPPFRVDLGESFCVETVEADHRFLWGEEDLEQPAGPMSWNPCTGPVAVAGVRAGEVIAVHIKDLKVVGHSSVGIKLQDGQPPLLPDGVAQARQDFVPIEGGIAVFPGGIRVPTKPMFGCFGVVPAKPSPEPWDHGGNLDIPDICVGNVIHLRCQREEAWFGCGDGHAVQGEGEMNGISLEVGLEGELSIDRSPYQKIQGILIESPDKFMMVGLGKKLRDGVVTATYAMSRFFAEARKIDELQAFEFVSHVADLRFGAAWPLWSQNEELTPVPVTLHLSKKYFE